MGFHIGFVNQVKAVNVAKAIQGGIVRVMAGADGVDVILLHGNDVKEQLLRLGNPPCGGTKFMAVSALKDNALPIQAHQPVFHLELAEPYPLGNGFCDSPVFIRNGKEHFI